MAEFNTNHIELKDNIINKAVENDTNFREIVYFESINEFSRLSKEEVYYLEQYQESDDKKYKHFSTTDTIEKNSATSLKFQYINSHKTIKYKKSHRGKCALCNGSKIVKAYTCDSCEYATVRSRDLKRHIDIVHNFKTTASYNKCDLCDFKSTKSQLKRHVEESHVMEKKFKCQLCKFFTYEKKQLSLHIEETHMNFEGVKCEFCNYTTKMRSHLKYHVNNKHLKAEQFICDICCYSTEKKYLLKTHIECVHLGTKNYHCSFCDYSTSKRCYLRSHLSDVHLKLNSHQCHICGIVLARKSHLKFHIDSIHLKSADKEHKCEKCDYSTWKKSDLKRHTKVHFKVKSQ